MSCCGCRRRDKEREWREGNGREERKGSLLRLSPSSFSVAPFATALLRCRRIRPHCSASALIRRRIHQKPASVACALWPSVLLSLSPAHALAFPQPAVTAGARCHSQQAAAALWRHSHALPSRCQASKVETEKAEFNPDFVVRMMPRIEYRVFIAVARQVGVPRPPRTLCSAARPACSSLSAQHCAAL